MHKKLIWDPACSANSGDIDNDLQSDCHSDSDSCAPEVMVPDARVFSSIKNEQKYPWLYDSVVHQGYLCKFCGYSSSSQECVTVGINLDRYFITGHPN